MEHLRDGYQGMAVSLVYRKSCSS